MKKYNAGDVVWWANCGTKQVKKPCPVCFGKLKVTVILGDDTVIETPCRMCALGYGPPVGYVTNTEYISEVKQITITRVDAKESVVGTEYEYYSSNYVLTGRIFDTKEEAESKCREIIIQHEIDLVTRTENIKKEVTKSYSWHVGYYRRLIADAKRQIERNEKLVTICKAKSRDVSTLTSKEPPK